MTQWKKLATFAPAASFAATSSCFHFPIQKKKQQLSSLAIFSTWAHY